MPVGSGSIKRAAKANESAAAKAAEQSVKTTEEKEAQTAPAAKKGRGRKAADKKPTVKGQTAAKGQIVATDRKAESDQKEEKAAAQNGKEQKIYHVTEELPIYLL
ncbi:MAG: hypothetical protein NC417_09205 [Candidatus Gastranaerophilales bacterium]|nr:hypothetical protein [Candidatus Gastranaerophilales bacterium]